MSTSDCFSERGPVLRCFLVLRAQDEPTSGTRVRKFTPDEVIGGNVGNASATPAAIRQQLYPRFWSAALPGCPARRSAYWMERPGTLPVTGE